MRRFWNTRIWHSRFWTKGRKQAALVVTVMLLGAFGVSAYQAYWEVKHELPAYLSQLLTQAMHRRVTVSRVGFRLPATFTLGDLRVEPVPPETRPPLVSRGVGVGIDWWGILVHRRLQVKGLTLWRPQVVTQLDLRKKTPRETNAVASLLVLRQQGLERLAMRHGEAEVLTTMPDGNQETVHASDLSFTTYLKPHSVNYEVSAGHWLGAGLEAQKLQVSGVAGEDGAIQVKQSRAQFRGGELQANGTYVSQQGDVAMKVRVKDLPIGNLSEQLGIPKEWNFQGQITGAVDMSATSGALKRVQGQIQVARGFVTRSQATFPWTSATANVDWKPEAIRLDRIDVQGNGVRLQANANVGGKADEPVTNRPFTAGGTVTANNTQSVASLAQLLAFSAPVPGRWDIGQTSIQFQAQGVVGHLEQARATGKLQATGFMVKPTAQSAPLVIRSVSADVVRGPTQLRLENVQAAADGLAGGGQLVVVPTVPGRPGKFTGAGKLGVTSLATIHQQLPDLPIWQWLKADNPAARGEVRFAVNGPTQHPDKAGGAGSFELSGLNVAVATGGSQTWTFPIRTLRGGLRMADNRLTLSDISLRSDLFTGGGDLTLTPVSDTGRVTGRVRLASERWQELPPLRGKVPPGLKGGLLVLETSLHDAPVTGGRLPLGGAVTLQNATYTGTIKGQTRTTRLDTARADFKSIGKTVQVSDYRLHTPLFATSGRGTLHQLGGAWSVDAQGVLTTADAGAVMKWWSGKTQLIGGDLRADYHVTSAGKPAEDAVAQARIRLADAHPVLPNGSLPFKAEDARIVSLTGSVSVQGKTVRFTDAVWKAPRFTVKGSGVYDGTQVNADASLSTKEWQGIANQLARSLPVAGGTLTVSGHIQGSPQRLKDAPLTGVITLRGARLASDRNASVPVQGGVLDLRANTRGTLGNLVRSDIRGNFSLRDLLLPAFRTGRERVRLTSAHGDFARNGTRVTISNLEAQASGAHLTGSGELRGVGTGSASHSLRFAASGPALAGMLPALVPLPGKATGGAFSGSLTLAGTAKQPVTEMEGRAQVKGGEWTPPGQTAAMKIDHLAAHFVRHGENATLDNLEAKVGGGFAQVAGTVQGLGTAAGPRHNLHVKWELEDASAWASRFFPVPGWFSGGTFTGNAKVIGTLAQPAQSASGDFSVTDAGFMPPAQILGGPVRPISVKSAKGLFQRAGGRTELTKLALDTSVGTATGTITAVDHAGATINANANIAELQTLIDLWPGFKGRIDGGHAQMTVALHGPLRQPRQLAGTVDIRAAGGTLTVKNVDPVYAEHPFDELSTKMVLRGDGAVLFQDVKMRGPHANLDGTGKVLADGTVEGKGQAWFAKDYTKKIFKPKFLYPVAKLFGQGKMHTRYELHGTLASARLDLGIKDSVLWKLGLKKRIPESLKDIAIGKAPLWGSPILEEKVAGVRMETRAKKRK